MKNCLIIDQMHPTIEEMLASIGWQADYRPDITRPDIVSSISSYQGLIFRSKTKIDKEILEHAGQLKFIGRAGAGLDMIDIDEVKRRGITVINAPEGNRDALAEHAIGMILTLLNKIHTGDRQVRERLWKREENRGAELGPKIVGIIGYGFMGQAFAKRLVAFGCSILVYDKYKRAVSSGRIKEATLEEIFAHADIVSLHIPLNKDTRNMIDEVFLSKFQKNIYLINTARGELISLQTLEKALKSGKILGAALDVLENEKLNTFSPEQNISFEYLKTCNNVLLTPHVAGWSNESYVKINEVLVEKLGQSGL